MLRTERFTLTAEPQKVTTAQDNDIPGHAVTVVSQSTGLLVVCSDIDSYATGARIPMIPGQTVAFDNLGPSEEVWVASPDGIDIDTIESGVV